MMEYVVQGKYSGYYGWEDLTAETDLAEAEARLAEYDENEPTVRHRITKKWIAR